MKQNKVFLGGTCCDSTWREKLIPMIEGKVDYFNPVVKDWTPACQQREYEEKEICRYQVYVITPLMKGVFSIAEIIESVHTADTKTFVYIQKEDSTPTTQAIFDYGQLKSLSAVCDLAAKHGAVICYSLEDLADKLITQSVIDNPETDEKEALIHWSLYAENEEEWEDYCNEDGCLELVISPTTGIVHLLINGNVILFAEKSLFLKVVDSFRCDYLNEEYEGYVPEIKPFGEGGWGDYVEFITDDKGKMIGWNNNAWQEWWFSRVSKQEE